MDEDDELERAALLPELQRVLSSVNNILISAINSESRPSLDDCSPNIDSSHLPWRLPNHGIETNMNSPGDDSSDVSNQSMTTIYRRPDPRSQLDSSQLRQLAPLIDRLGRTLIDAAPHIASVADSLAPSIGNNQLPPLSEEDPIQSLAARASHLYFGVEDTANINSEGLPSLENNSNVSQNNDVPALFEQVEDETITDPDLTDYINGMVNTTRGDSRSERNSNRDPIGSSLLASYLSQAGIGGIGGQSDLNDEGAANLDNPLGRVIRVGSGNGGGGNGAGGPGIDIHIHAIVTGPGMNSFGGGGLGGGLGTTAATMMPVATNFDGVTPARASGITSGTAGVSMSSGDQNGDDEDLDLFSELYTESPNPLNLHGNEISADIDNDRDAEGIEDGCNDLNQLFEDCHMEEIDIEGVTEPEPSFTLESSIPHAEATDNSSSHAASLLVNEDVVTDNASIKDSSPMDHQLANDDSINEGSVYVPSEHNADGDRSTSQESTVTSTTSSQRESSRSPSFTNRLFRRTIGRLSNSNRRPSPPP